MHPGQGPGLSLHDLGETGGSETVTLNVSEIPVHTHNLNAAAGDPAETNVPTSNAMARSNLNVYATPGTLVQMSTSALTPTGGGLPHNNMMPYLTLNFCIAMQGVFPPRG
jgi:microcystin-dependent protein